MRLYRKQISYFISQFPLDKELGINFNILNNSILIILFSPTTVNRNKSDFLISKKVIIHPVVKRIANGAFLISKKGKRQEGTGGWAGVKEVLRSNLLQRSKFSSALNEPTVTTAPPYLPEG